MKAKHPARYHPSFVEVFAEVITDHASHLPRWQDILLDPMAGTGERLKKLADLLGVGPLGFDIHSHDWADTKNFVYQGNACALELRDSTVQYIVVSPTYGNGMNDNFRPREMSSRNAYLPRLVKAFGHDVEVPEDSSINHLFDSDEYRDIHRRAWAEAWRVLEPGGLFVLNTKNCGDRRRGQKVASYPVTAWHRGILMELGFVELEHRLIPVRGHGHSETAQRASDFESIVAFRKPVQAVELRSMTDVPVTPEFEVDPDALVEQARAALLAIDDKIEVQKKMIDEARVEIRRLRDSRDKYVRLASSQTKRTRRSSKQEPQLP